MNWFLKRVLWIWLILTLFIIAGLLASVAHGLTKVQIHIEKIDTRATISCTDHKAPVIRIMKNEPVVVVDCDPERKTD